MVLNFVISVIPYLILFLGLGISLWVFLANRKLAANILLAVFIVLTTFFVFLSLISYSLHESGIVTLTMRGIYGIAFIALGTLNLFLIFFPYRSKSYWLHKISIAICLSVFATATFTDLVISSVEIQKNGNQIINYGLLSPIYDLLIFLIVTNIIIFVIRKYLKSDRKEKTRIQYFLMGLVLYLTTNLVFSILLPFFYENNVFDFVPDLSVILFFSFSAYAIVKHRLMDIRMVVARSVAYTLLLGVIGSFYVFSMVWLERIIFGSGGQVVNWAQISFRIVVGLLVIFTFQPLRKFITKKTDRIFFKQAYDPDTLLDTLAHTMSSTIVLIELLYKVLNILASEMKVSRGFFVVLKDEKTIDTTQGVGYKKSPNVSLKEVEVLAKDGLCIYDELDDGSQVKRILRKHDASVAIPLKSKNRLSGILFLGEKASGDMYSAQDIRIFEILGPEVTVAIENAKSYEEIQRFNVVLREEIAKATKDLEKANQNLKELDKAKDEFISMASHQLRTPLTAIKGYLSMLLEGDAGEIKMGQYEFVQEAYYGATRMVSLINDLLNVSRMETGRFFLEVTEFDMTKTVEEEVKQLEKVAKDKGLKLVYQKHGHVSLCADEMKVRQVVMNFVDNAIYYTPNGKVMVNLYDEGKNVRFEVTDNGIGVPKEQQKHLFTKFYRAENARSARPDGTGLGLFMAKKVIEEHHGELIFRSVEDKGSTFGFRLPKVAEVAKDSASGFDKNIPLETPVDKAIEVMDEKMKERAKVE